MAVSPSVADPGWSECETAIKRFEAAWRQGARPDLSAFADPASPHFPQLLAELAHIDLEFRIRAGEEARVEEYLARFPRALAGRDTVLDLITTEYALRNRYAPPARREEYLLRFPEYLADLRDLMADPRGRPGLTTRPHTRPVGFAGRPVIPGYELLDVLGRGGMGVVYKARHAALGRVVAVKTFAYPPGDEDRDRFRREGEAIARLDCPNVVPVYEVGEWRPDDGGPAVPFFVMKWYPGGSLAAAPAGPGTDPAAHARTVEALARAVHHAHQRGVLHRDLKPSNILLDEAGEPHVADFGLAGRIGPDVSATGVVVGTPAYMAPEQAKAPARVTTAADVYGLGAVLYHLLTGRPPFRADTALATLDLAATRPPVRPAAVNPAVPRDLEIICLKCLEKDPARRYGSAEAVAEDLRRFRDGRPITARPAGAWEHARRWVGRHPLLAGMAAVTLLALVGAVVTLAVSNARILAKEQETAAALGRERAALGELQAALRRERDLHYDERVGLAGRLWQGGEAEAAWRVLDLCPAAQRGWEWRFLDRLRHPTAVELPGSGPRALTCGFGPGGRLAIGGMDGSVTVWDVRTGARLALLRVAAQPIQQVLHPDADTVIATAAGAGMIVWDLPTRAPRFTADAGREAAVSPDGRHVAAPGRTAVRVFELKTGKPVREYPMHMSGYMAAAYSPDGRRLALSGRGVRVLDLATGLFVGPLRERPLVVADLAFTADGRLVEAAGIGIGVTDTVTGVVRTRLESVSLGRVRPAGPGNRIAVPGTGHTVRVRDLDQNRDVFTTPRLPGSVTDFDVSPDGRFLVAVGVDMPARVWDLEQEADVRALGGGGPLATGPGGRVAVARDTDPALGPTADEIAVFDSDGRVVARRPGGRAVALGPGGRLAHGTHDGRVAVWDSATGAVERVVSGVGGPVEHLAFAGDGALAAAFAGGAVLVWPPGGGEPRRFPSTRGRVDGLAFHPDGRLLAVAGPDGPVGVWDVATGVRVAEFGSKRGARAVAFSPDGTLLATADPDGGVRLRDPQTGLQAVILSGHDGVADVAFSPDGARVMTVGADRTARVWDRATGQELLSLPGLTGPGRRCGWSADGTRVYATDGVLRVWDARLREKR